MMTVSEDLRHLLNDFIICTKNGHKVPVFLCKSVNRSVECSNYHGQLNPKSEFFGVCIWQKNAIRQYPYDD
jgi:hypothetical protein